VAAPAAAPAAFVASDFMAAVQLVSPGAGLGSLDRLHAAASATHTAAKINMYAKAFENLHTLTTSHEEWLKARVRVWGAAAEMRSYHSAAEYFGHAPTTGNTGPAWDGQNSVTKARLDALDERLVGLEAA
jgi:hypothetical protein